MGRSAFMWLFYGSLGALYRPLILYMPLVSACVIDVNAFKGTINLKHLCPGQWLEFKP
jgi:hypothetical protein